MITELKVGDVHEQACNLIHKCGELVRLDNTLSPMEKEHAINKLYHAQCYIMLDQFNLPIGE